MKDFKLPQKVTGLTLTRTYTNEHGLQNAVSAHAQGPCSSSLRGLLGLWVDKIVEQVAQVRWDLALDDFPGATG